MIVKFKFRLCSSSSVWRCLLQLGCTHFIISSSHVTTDYSLKYIVLVYQRLKLESFYNIRFQKRIIKTIRFIQFIAYWQNFCITKEYIIPIEYCNWIHAMHFFSDINSKISFESPFCPRYFKINKLPVVWSPKISLPICIPTSYYKATDISHITIDDKWNKRMMMMIWNGYYDIIL